jgi:hypothetical protein
MYLNSYLKRNGDILEYGNNTKLVGVGASIHIRAGYDQKIKNHAANILHIYVMEHQPFNP